MNMKTRLVFAGFLAFTLCAQAQNYKVRSIAWERLEVTRSLDATPDAEAMAVVGPYKASVDSIVAPVLGQSMVAMDSHRPESTLTNWATDVLVEASTATGLPRADFGVMNVGGLRSNMPCGIVRRGDIMLISPFENYVTVVEMKGSTVLELFANIARNLGEGVSSSVRLVITRDGQLVSSSIDGQPVDPDRVYRVATIDYLSEGNDRLTAFKKGIKRHDMGGLLVREAMMESIIKNRNITSKIEGRVTVQQ